MRVVIVEDQVLLRAGLARLFVDGGHEVVATLGDATTLAEVVETHGPDLVIARHTHAPDVHRRRVPRRPRPQVPPSRDRCAAPSQHIETAHAVDLVGQPASATC